MADLAGFQEFVRQTNLQVEQAIQEELARGQYDTMSDIRDNASYTPRDAAADIEAAMETYGITLSDLQQGEAKMDLGYGNTIYGGDYEPTSAQAETGRTETGDSRGDTTGEFTLLDRQEDTTFDEFLSLATMVLGAGLAGPAGAGTGGIGESGITPDTIYDFMSTLAEVSADDGYSPIDPSETNTSQDTVDLNESVLDQRLTDFERFLKGINTEFDPIVWQPPQQQTTDQEGGGGSSSPTENPDNSGSQGSPGEIGTLPPSSIVGSIFDEYDIDSILNGYRVDNQLPTSQIPGQDNYYVENPPELTPDEVTGDFGGEQPDVFQPPRTFEQALEDKWANDPASLEAAILANPGAFGFPTETTTPVQQQEPEKEKTPFEIALEKKWAENPELLEAAILANPEAFGFPSSGGTGTTGNTGLDADGNEPGTGLVVGSGAPGGGGGNNPNNTGGSGTGTGSGDGSGTGDGTGDGDGDGDGNGGTNPGFAFGGGSGKSDDSDLFGYRTFLPSQPYQVRGLMDYVAALQKGRVL